MILHHQMNMQSITCFPSLAVAMRLYIAAWHMALDSSDNIPVERQ